MFQHIGEGFLHDTEHGQFKPGRQWALVADHRELRLKPRLSTMRNRGFEVGERWLRRTRAVLGVAVGLLFGWGVVHALPDDFASTMVIPVQSILTLVVVAALAGVVAAVLPARRAGRLNVLNAISH